VRRLAAALAAWAALAPAALLPTTTPPAAAQADAAAVWVQVGSETPGPGCWVDTSVEVRRDGVAVPDLDVVLALHVDAEIFSVQRGVTGADGLAFAGFDTSGIAAERVALLDVNIADQYAGSVPITVTDGAGCNDNPEVEELSTSVPMTVSTASHSADDGWTSGDGEVVSLWVPAIPQRRGLSCEYASLSIAMGAFGVDVSEYAFDSIVGWSENPHWGYRGNIEGVWGGTDDYGVYAEPLVAAAEAYGFWGDVFYANGNASALTARIDQGTPVLVWLSLLGETGWVEEAADGTPYRLIPGQHTLVVYGYDEAGVYASDPALGAKRFYDWGWFMSMWNAFDGMAMGVGPY
jgi:uncharacterized protein YvpB